MGADGKLRIDKWLWHGRFFKTRSLAAKVVSAGHCRINGQHIAKPSATVAPGDTRTFPQGRDVRVIKVLALGERRAHIDALTSDYPGSLQLSHKLRSTEMTRRMRQFAINLQGAAGGLYVGDDQARQGGFWQRAYFNSFSATIGGGTSQVQANIVAEHILGLPK